MSKYAYIEGHIIFSNEDNKAKAVQYLADNGWLQDGHWNDLGGGLSEAVDETGLVLRIPKNLYRNLINYVHNLTALAKSYEIIWASSDGDFTGGSISSHGGSEVNLFDWADKHCKQDRPQEEEFDTEDEYHEEFENWKDAVIEAFMDSPRF